uniref:C2H2-type domain-containing protein n=1 Tax=Cacopsylla melanoneura TaxID=428564 RepID=A0A8D8ZHA6_9HEMI
MPETRISHRIAFSQLASGKRAQVKPKKRWSDVIKEDLKVFNIDPEHWRNAAADRPTWRQSIHTESEKHHLKIIQHSKKKRTERHIEGDKFDWKCPLCDFLRSGRTGRQYVTSHMSQKHPREMEQSRANTMSLTCHLCGFVCRSKSGLSSHLHHKHPDFQQTGLKPMQIRAAQSAPNSTTTTTGSQITSTSTTTAVHVTVNTTTTSNSSVDCPWCVRSRGLARHIGSSTCRRQDGGHNSADNIGSR